jgi:hypothetical protein
MPEIRLKKRSRAAFEAYVKAHAIDRGIVWVREHVFARYHVRSVGQLSDAALIELAAKAERCG